MTNPLLADGAASVQPVVGIGKAPLALPLPPTVDTKLLKVVVDTHLHLPDMFELTFIDEEGTLADDAGLSIGAQVTISGGAATSADSEVLISGEVTSIEAVCADLHIYTVIRGYNTAHRLQRGRHSRTFLNMTDSDIASQIADEAGLDIGTVDDTKAVHTHIGQVAQTDWDFLQQRAAEVGYETGVDNDGFYFRKPSSASGDGGGLMGAVASAAASLTGGGPATLTFKDNLLTFLPRITGANVTPEVEVRAWDPDAAEIVSSQADVETGTVDIEDQDPADLANSFGGFGLPIPIPPMPPIPGLPSLGQAPSDNAYVLVNRPLADGSGSTAADEVAAGLAEHVGSVFAEAEGEAMGDPKISAGKVVEVKGVPKQFEGKWVVTQARHVFSDEEAGYRTRFYVSGRQDRTLLGLASKGGPGSSPAQFAGVVCGVVTNNNDPDQKGRVKVTLPWLSPQYETDWARVAHFGAGRKSGGMFTPEVGDEVLIAFEHGDSRRPYVIGGLINSNTSYDLGGPAVKSQGMSGAVVKRGFVSAAGNRLVFEDELLPPPASGPPLKSAMSFGTSGDELTLKLDQTGGTVDLFCKPAPPASHSPIGTLTIECGQAGTINIKTGAGGSVNIDGGATLSLKAQASLSIESQGVVEIKGQFVKIN
jgi:hypothetical protein